MCSRKLSLILYFYFFLSCLANAQTFSNNTSTSIPINGFIVPVPAYPMNNTITVAGITNPLDGVNFGLSKIEININAAVFKAIRLFIASPDGTLLELFHDRGPASAVNGLLVFSSDPTSQWIFSWPGGAIPANGFNPDAGFQGFNNNQMPNGVWQLFGVYRSGTGSAIIPSWSLTFGNTNILPAEANDLCANATSLVLDTKVNGNNRYYTTTKAERGAAVCSSTNMENTAWYKFTPVCKDDKILFENAPDSPAQVGIVTGCTSTSPYASLCRKFVNSETYTFAHTNYTPGTTYYLIVDGDDSYYVKYGITWQKGTTCPILPTIQTQAVTNKVFCPSENISIPFTITGTYNAGNIFTAQLSNASGSFASPVSLGTLNATTAGSINATIPSSIAPGSGYRIRVIASNPATTGSDNGTNIVIQNIPSVPGTITGNLNPCSTATGIQYAVGAAANALTYFWTLPSGANIVNKNSDSSNVTVNFAGNAGAISVRGRNSCGLGPSRSDNIVFTPLPASPSQINGPSTVCPNQIGVAYNITIVSGASSYFWSLPSGASIASLVNPDSSSITVNFGNTPGNISVQSRNACGLGTARTLAISFSANPSQPTQINGPAQVCPFQMGVDYSVTVISGIAYNWKLPSGATFVSANGADSSSIKINFGASLGDILVEAESSCGKSGYFSKNISKGNGPSAPTSIQDPTQVCANKNAVAYSVPLVSGASSYFWSLPSGASIASVVNSDSSNITVNFGNTPGNISVQSRNACGLSTARTLAVSFSASPSQPTQITGPAQVCPFQMGVDYSVTAISGIAYNWKLPSGATFVSANGADSSSIKINFGASLGDILVEAESSCGKSGYFSKNISKGNGPSAPTSIQGPTQVCASENAVAYSVPLVSGASSYFWSLPSGASIASVVNSDSSNITVNFGNTPGNISVQSRNACGLGIARTLVVSFSANPSQPTQINGPAQVCPFQMSVDYSVTAISGIAYNWKLPSGATFVSANGADSSSIKINFGASLGDILVEAESSCGKSGYFSKNISKGNGPSAPTSIQGPTQVCASENAVVYSVPLVSGASSYFWSLPSGASIASVVNSDSSNITVNLGNTPGNISVQSRNACGLSTARTLAVSFSANPSQPTQINGPAQVCPFQMGVDYSVTAISGIAYNWKLPSGAIFVSANGADSSSIKINYGASLGNISVEAESSCGKSGYFSKTISKGNGPSAPTSIQGSTQVCANEKAVVYSVPLVSGASSYFWSLPSGASIASLVNPDSSSITVNFGNTPGNISVQSRNACGLGIARTLAVSFSANPSQPTQITGPAQVCPFQMGVDYSVTANSGIAYNWKLPSGATFVSANGADSSSIKINFGASLGDILVEAESSCGKSGYFSKSITKGNGLSAPTSIQGPTEVCANANAVAYSVSLVSGASSYFWSLPSGASIASLVNPDSSSITVNFGNTPGNISVQSRSSCGLSADAVIKSISFSQSPQQPSAIEGPASVCANVQAVLFKVNPVLNTNFKWVFPSGTIIKSANADSSEINIAVGNTGGNVEVFARNTCGLSQQASTTLLTINTKPETAGIVDVPSSVCINKASFDVSTSPVANSLYYHWSVPTGYSIISASGSDSLRVTIKPGKNEGTISLSAVNECGSSDPVSMNFTVDSLPQTPDISGKSEICPTERNNLNYAVTAQSSYQYSWRIDPSFIVNSAAADSVELNVSLSPSASQGTLMVWSKNQCGLSEVSKSITVKVAEQAPSVKAVTIDNNICKNSSATFKAKGINGGSNPVFSWFVDGVLQPGITDSIFTISNVAANTVVKTSMASSLTCANPAVVESAEITVTVVDILYPSISISAIDTNICEGTSTEFTAIVQNAGSGYSLQWSINGFDIPGETQITFAPTVLNNNDTIRCMLSSVSPCAATPNVLSGDITMKVLPNVVPEITIIGEDTVCQKAQVSFMSSVNNGGNAPAYEWFVGGLVLSGADKSNISFVADQTTEVYSRLTSSEKCASPRSVSSNKIILKVNSFPVDPGNILGESKLCEGDQGKLYTTQNISQDIFIWTVPINAIGNSSGNKIEIDFGNAGKDSIKVQTQNGCGLSEIRSLYVEVEQCDILFVPNIIELAEGSWKILGLEKYPKIKIKVFNRWGASVYEGGGGTNWDGKYKGVTLPTGTYYYVIELNNATKDFLTGSVTLIK